MVIMASPLFYSDLDRLSTILSSSIGPNGEKKDKCVHMIMSFRSRCDVLCRRSCPYYQLWA